MSRIHRVAQALPPANPIAASLVGTMSGIRSFGRLVLALLREIGDENAYQRHLAAHGCAHSGAEWRRFSEKRLRAKYARAKCC